MSRYVMDTTKYISAETAAWFAVIYRRWLVIYSRTVRYIVQLWVCLFCCIYLFMRRLLCYLVY